MRSDQSCSGLLSAELLDGRELFRLPSDRGQKLRISPEARLQMYTFFASCECEGPLF